MRILHTADIHLGKPFRRLGSRAENYQNQLKKTFENLCRLAIKKEVDLLVIAGDLFDANAVPESLLQFTKSELRKVSEAGVKIVITAGTHDRLEGHSVYTKHDWSDINNLTVLMPDNSRIDFDEFDLTVCGASNVYNKSTESPLQKLATENLKKYSIAILHASVAVEGKYAPDDYPVTVEEIESSPFRYIAFGHWHRAQEIVKDKAWYAGSPETLSLQEEGAGKVLIVDMNDNGVTITPEHIGQVHFDKVDIEVLKSKSLPDLAKRIQEDTDDMLIREVELHGALAPDDFIDAQALKQMCEESFFGLRIIDKTHLQLDDAALQNFPDELVIGKYIRLLKEEIEAEEDEGKRKRLEKALQLGVALLSGKEVL